MQVANANLKIAFLVEALDDKINSQLESLCHACPEFELKIFAAAKGKEKLLDKLKTLINSGAELSHEAILNLEYQPDLIIKLGSNKSLDNSLVLGSSYAEIYFSDKDFSDFNSEDLKLAIHDFRERQRNFGI